jgi:hypothetical protein
MKDFAFMTIIRIALLAASPLIAGCAYAYAGS